MEFNLSSLKSSWTKYDIVRVIEVIESIDVLNKYLKKEAKIDEPILKSFLCINHLSDKIPSYWYEIQKYPSEKKIFAFLSTIFTHYDIIKKFADEYSRGKMKGVFFIKYDEKPDGKKHVNKKYTNIRSLLIESEISEKIYRRSNEVPYDLTPIFQNLEAGKLFKQLLLDRLGNLTKLEITDSDFYEICDSNLFYKALSLSKDQFKSWLEGQPFIRGSYIDKIEIDNFFSIRSATLELNSSKEVYFLGENGDGKTLFLMAIYLAFNGNYISNSTDQEKTGKATDILRNNTAIKLTGSDIEGNTYGIKNSFYLQNMFAYGTHRGRYSTENSEKYGFMSLFDSDETLINPISWLKDQKLEENQNNKSIISISLIKKIFAEILDKKIEIKFEGSDILFNEKGYTLKFDQLSEGYKSIIIFIIDLLYRLSKNYSNKISTQDYKAVVLVDEIDLHLHPKWQRRIIKKLRNLFPKIQFIFTTHSPSIIQGASDDAILYRVYRDLKTGYTHISDPFYRKNIDHLMINTLLTSPLFGLEDSRMNTDNNEADTSDTYLNSRINKRVEEKLDKEKENGKIFICDNEIDDLIDEIINDELNKND